MRSASVTLQAAEWLGVAPTVRCARPPPLFGEEEDSYMIEYQPPNDTFGSTWRPTGQVMCAQQIHTRSP